MVGVPALITETFRAHIRKHHRARTHKPEVNKHTSPCSGRTRSWGGRRSPRRPSCPGCSPSRTCSWPARSPRGSPDPLRPAVVAAAVRVDCRGRPPAWPAGLEQARVREALVGVQPDRPGDGHPVEAVDDLARRPFSPPGSLNPVMSVSHSRLGSSAWKFLFTRFSGALGDLAGVSCSPGRASCCRRPRGLLRASRGPRASRWRGSPSRRRRAQTVRWYPQHPEPSRKMRTTRPRMSASRSQRRGDAGPPVLIGALRYPQETCDRAGGAGAVASLNPSPSSHLLLFEIEAGSHPSAFRSANTALSSRFSIWSSLEPGERAGRGRGVIDLSGPPASFRWRFPRHDSTAPAGVAAREVPCRPLLGLAHRDPRELRGGGGPHAVLRRPGGRARPFSLLYMRTSSPDRPRSNFSVRTPYGVPLFTISISFVF